MNLGCARSSIEPKAERLAGAQARYARSLFSQFVNRDALRGDRQMRLVVDRLPRGFEVLNAAQRIGAREQRPLKSRPFVSRLPLQSRKDCLRTRVETEHQCSCPAEHLPVPDFRIDGSAATSGNHYSGTGEEL